MHTKGKHAGVRVRHTNACRTNEGSCCSCRPAYEAFIYSPREGRKIRKTLPSLAAAKAWRSDAHVALRRGELRQSTRVTLREAADAFLAGARDGTVRTRSGDRYKPSAVRGYEQALRDRVLPDLGGARLGDVRRGDVQDLADRLLGAGLDPSTIRNALMPLRAIYRRAVTRGDVAVNPTTDLELPAVRGRRDRIASPAEAAELLAALRNGDRALWATALYAGLRRGELRGLRWEDVALSAGVIRVERSFDSVAGVVEPKSAAGTRTVPIARVLREQLVAHRLRSGRATGYVFGVTGQRAFDPRGVARRAATAWKHANAQRAEANVPALVPITLHQARHTFASLMIAAGVNAKSLSTYMGHSSITITLDRYGHLMPGNEEEAAGMLDAYLARGAPSLGSG